MVCTLRRVGLPIPAKTAKRLLTEPPRPSRSSAGLHPPFGLTRDPDLNRLAPVVDRPTAGSGGPVGRLHAGDVCAPGRRVQPVMAGAAEP
jgi:hypothetical protein